MNYDSSIEGSEESPMITITQFQVVQAVKAKTRTTSINL